MVSDTEWTNVCTALGQAAWVQDPRFATFAGRARHSDAAAMLLAEVFATQPAAHWAERMLEADAPAMAVEPPEEVFRSDTARANELFEEVEQPRIGRVLLPRTPFRMSGGSQPPFRPSPTLGEHTDQILAEAGYGAEEIHKLRELGAVG